MIALALKHLHHHALALAVGGVLLGSTVFTGWVLVLSEQMATLMNAATGVLYYMGPMYILYVNQRLVSSDYDEGTSEFLSALPLTTLTRLLVPFALGLVAIAITFEALMLSTAVLATRREGVPLSWLFTLHIQVGLYAFAWHCLAFGAAHLGRYRWLMWWVFFVLVMGIDGTWVERPFRTVLWHGILADPTEQARSVPPWDAVPVTLLWAALGLLVALVLATYRGGSLVEAWYAPSTGRQRGSLVAAGVVSMFLGTALEETAPRPDTWSTLQALPAQRSEVKVAGSQRLEAVGADVVAALDTLGARIQADPWPPVVLHPSARGLHRHVRRAVGYDDTALVLLVDPDGPHEMLVRGVLTEVLDRQTGDLGSRIPGLDKLIQGTPGWLRPDEALETRWAVLAGIDRPPTRLMVGEDLAEAHAVQWMEGIEHAAGEDTVFALLEQAFASQRGSGLPAYLRARLTFREGWLERLTRLESVPLRPAAVPRVAPPLPPLRIDAEDDAWVANLAWKAPQGAVLERVALDALEMEPPPGTWSRLESASARDRLSLALDSKQPVAARLVLYWPPIEGWLATPWAIQ